MLTAKLFDAIKTADRISIDGYDTEGDLFKFIGAGESAVLEITPPWEDNARISFKNQDIKIGHGLARVLGEWKDADTLKPDEPFEFHFAMIRQTDMDYTDVSNHLVLTKKG